MSFRSSIVISVALLTGALLAQDAAARTSVTYGRITAARQVDVQNQSSRNAGTLVGGALGVASGSGQSRSNRALRGIGGAAVGSSVAGNASRTTGFEYTVLLGGTSTIRMVTDQSGLRVGDCVSVERGSMNNLRLAPDERCDVPAAVSAADASAADACAAVKQQLIDAKTDEEFDRAERRMRLLCD